MQLSTELSAVKGVGDALAGKLAGLGLHSVQDIINYYPRRYDDYSSLVTIGALMPGPVTVQAQITEAKGRYVRRGLHITEAVASDGTGSVRLVWFNQPYRAAALKVDQEYFVTGEFGMNNRRFSIQNPNIELVSDFPVNTARILPKYRETKGLSSKQIRNVLAKVVPVIRALPEQLPPTIIKENKLVSYAEALEQIHFPESSERLATARRRLAFQEVFELITASLLNKAEIMQEEAPRIPFDEAVAKQFVAALPFPLTNAQRKTAWAIYQDMQTEHPMNRLIEGDVGSGKTVVAAMAAVMVSHAGMQTALMAPTELLARQHAETLYKLLEPIGRQDEVVLLVGGLKPAEKTRARAVIANGQAKLIIGTHALIQEKVDTHSLALVVIDEQHRFGVEQRKELMRKSGHMPHVLSLTATPIPRSLALTLYGELDVSILDEKPPGRQPVVTKICSPNSRKQLYAEIEAELAAGRQMFVVCPLIEDSEVLQATSVEATYKEISKAFPGRSAGLLHGKMKPEDKQAMMQQFMAHQIDILVSTTVIEVGVDVPNASIMLVESAERFGLAQIHQLRGRIGRGGHKGYCYLMMSDSKAPSRRLRALESSNDGFKLAELDLEIRGPGAIYGSLQHGALDLRIASLSDTPLLAAARKAANGAVKNPEELLHYTQLWQRIQTLRKVSNLN